MVRFRRLFMLQQVSFARLLSLGHNKCSVDHISSCISKNIFLTAGEKTVKLYDYRKKQVFLVYTFQDHIHSITLHPTGKYDLIGLI